MNGKLLFLLFPLFALSFNVHGIGGIALPFLKQASGYSLAGIKHSPRPKISLFAIIVYTFLKEKRLTVLTTEALHSKLK